MKSLIAASALAFLLGAGSAFAQTLAQTPAPAPAAPAAAAPAPAAPTDKKAISKSCSEQATAKGLHGKARKKFRSACKQRGGQPA